MREVDFDTFFTSSKMITLDSVYFQAGSRVQCAARAVNSDGDEGLELSSPVVIISKEEGEDWRVKCHFGGFFFRDAEKKRKKKRYFEFKVLYLIQQMPLERLKKELKC